MTRFFALLDGAAGAFGVSFPDCPGCTAMGKDANAAYANAIDALKEWIHDRQAEGEAAPKPSRLEELRRDPDVIATLAEGAIFLAVPVDRKGTPYKSIGAMKGRRFRSQGVE